MKLSALFVVSALLAEGIFALNCKDGLNYCGRSINLKNPTLDQDFDDMDLVHCAGDNVRSVERCYGGCIEAPAGKSDYCAPFAGFIISTGTDRCIELVGAAHRVAVEAAEKESKSVRELRLLRADTGFFRAMFDCLLLSAKANQGKSPEAAFKHTLYFYAKTLNRLQAELTELEKEGK